MNLSAVDVADVPAGEVTVTSTAPLALGAGLVTVSWVSLTTFRFVAAIDPKLTAVAPVNPVPVTVTVSPPLARARRGTDSCDGRSCGR